MPISIPYGSIKSLPEGQHPHYAAISIPYGSIKSKIIGDVSFKRSEFQFLMVRLKVSTWNSKANGTHISIPYGSIKRIFFRFRNSVSFISIPYGSIKSLHSLYNIVP